VHRSRHFRLLASAFASCAISALAPAGEAAEPASAVSDLLRAFRAERDAMLAPELVRYGGELAALELEMLAARDYRGAVAVQHERLRLSQLVMAVDPTIPPGGSGAAGADAPDGLVLSPPGAALSGGVRLDASSGALVGWENPGAHAEWALPAGWPTGGYLVEVTYSATGKGRVVLREDRFTLTREAEATAGPEPWVTRRFGTLRMTAGARTLRLEAAPGSPPPGFALKQLLIIPTDRDAPPP
jgi:hypothetical protein